MSPTIRVELAGAPHGKGRPRFRVVKTRAGATFGNAYTPAATRHYETNLQAAAVKAMKGRAPLEGALIVVVWAYMPIPESWSKKKRADAIAGTIYPTSKPDWENIAKTLDAFNGVVWQDDKQIVDGRVVKIYSERPALMVEVTLVESALTSLTGERAPVGKVENLL